MSHKHFIPKALLEESLSESRALSPKAVVMSITIGFSHDLLLAFFQALHRFEYSFDAVIKSLGLDQKLRPKHTVRILAHLRNAGFWETGFTDEEVELAEITWNANREIIPTISALSRERGVWDDIRSRALLMHSPSRLALLRKPVRHSTDQNAMGVFLVKKHTNILEGVDEASPMFYDQGVPIRVYGGSLYANEAHDFPPGVYMLFQVRHIPRAVHLMVRIPRVRHQLHDEVQFEGKLFAVVSSAELKSILMELRSKRAHAPSPGFRTTALTATIINHTGPPIHRLKWLTWRDAEEKYRKVHMEILEANRTDPIRQGSGRGTQDASDDRDGASAS